MTCGGGSTFSVGEDFADTSQAEDTARAFEIVAIAKKHDKKSMSNRPYGKPPTKRDKKKQIDAIKQKND